MKYSAIFTERNSFEADLLVIFTNRDPQAQEDVEGTRQNLEADGLGPHVRGFDRLADIPDVWDLRQEAEEAKAKEAAKAAALAAQIPEPQLNAIHSCLRLLAGHCDGARTLDGAGFNKMDAEFGHSLANAPKLSQKQAEYGLKLIRKYHRQLPADLLSLAVAHDVRSAGAGETPSSIINPLSSSASTPAQLVNLKYQNRSGHNVAHNGCEEAYGDTYQNGVRPGPKKLAQFIEVLKLAGTPALYTQEDKGDDALVHVKLFDPTGSRTWYITEFSEVAPDGAPNLAFGLVDGDEPELGYIDLAELSNVKGRMGIGIEIDMHFLPKPLRAVRESLHATAN